MFEYGGYVGSDYYLLAEVSDQACIGANDFWKISVKRIPQCALKGGGIEEGEVLLPDRWHSGDTSIGLSRQDLQIGGLIGQN